MDRMTWLEDSGPWEERTDRPSGSQGSLPSQGGSGEVLAVCGIPAP